MQKVNDFLSSKGVTTAFLFLVVAAIPLTVFIAQQNQDTRQRADSTVKPTLRVFGTNATYNGNLGGIVGADAKCQVEANAVTSLHGSTWKALLSDAHTNAKDRISDGKYVLAISQTAIANDKASLFSQNLLARIDKTAAGNAISGTHHVWTGSTNNGTSDTNTCLNWTSANSNGRGNGNRNDRGHFGQNDTKNNNWINQGNDNCQELNRLYCVEDAPIISPTTNPSVTPTLTPTPLPSSAPTATPVAGTPTPTPFGTTATPIPTQISSPTPTTGITLTPTLAATGSVQLAFSLSLQPHQAGGNTNPIHPIKLATVKIYQAGTQTLVAETPLSLSYNTTNNLFVGTGGVSTIAPGMYDVRIVIPQYLTKLFPNQTLANGINGMPQANLFVGDVNADNSLDILDYQIITNECFGERASLSSTCTAADLDDNGTIDIFDANYLFRNFAIRSGE